MAARQLAVIDGLNGLRKLQTVRSVPVLATITFLLVACAVAAPSSNVAPTATPPRDVAVTPVWTLSPDAEIQRIMELRRDWGLEDDEDLVRRLATDPSAVDSILGIPVTPDEAATLEAMFTEDPRSRLIAYGYGQPEEYADSYVERPGGGFVMLFTGHLELHRAAIEAFPGDFPFEVRLARYTKADLRALQSQVVDEFLAMDGVQMMSVGVDTIGNRVIAEAKSNDPTLEARLESEHQGMLDATIYPLPGPWGNVEAGGGWRLLVAGQGRPFDDGYNVSVATTADEWHALWAIVDPVNPEPGVDMESEIVVSFAHGIGSSCPELRLDDVVINAGARVVYSVTSDPLAPRVCTADLVGAAFFVVALARQALPPSPFVVRLREDRICGGDGCSFTEEVTVETE